MKKEKTRSGTAKDGQSAVKNKSNDDGDFFTAFGRVHPSLQRYDCDAENLTDLLDIIPPSHNPMKNWTGRNAVINPQVVSSWFPDDDNVAFYAPRPSTKDDLSRNGQDDNMKTFFSSDGTELWILNYRDLHDQISKCHPWTLKTREDSRTGKRGDFEVSEGNSLSNRGKVFTVAVLLPQEMMAEMAVVLLSVMSNGYSPFRSSSAGKTSNFDFISGVCAAPLDSRMTPQSLREAILQLKCDGLVTTDELMEKILLDKNDTSGATRESSHDILGRLEDIRFVQPDHGACLAGAVKWTIVRQNGVGYLREKAKSDVEDGLLLQDELSVQSATEKEENHVLLLRTSGTTSVPKVVPLKASALLYNAVCLSSSLQLRRYDIDLNAMPLFHIGGISCALLSVLVSGSSVMMHGPFEDPNTFLNRLLLPPQDAREGEGECNTVVCPTWYYGVPTMHRTVVLAAKGRMRATPDVRRRKDGDVELSLPNKLRFIRSGAAHLAHDLAQELSRVLNTGVIPTYSMSECMPICSESRPVFSTGLQSPIDSVGKPIGMSVRIVNADGKTLSRTQGNGEVDDSVFGEVAIKGCGVMKGYIGILSTEETHTPDGWLLTGDVGSMDDEGRVRLRGRTKEMIKRGGEQVWPNEIDDVIGKVDGVEATVTFGVPNELWGEEVACAVLLDVEECGNMNGKEDVLRNNILQSCRDNLSDGAVPRQILFVKSMSDLPRGPTGKYLRGEMAKHLRVTAADTVTLQALQNVASAGESGELCSQVAGEGNSATLLNQPSKALNGLRFVTACFVLQHHVGLYPNTPWLKIQTYSMNMTLFFLLGGFQLTCSVRRQVCSEWATFVGTKIGTMHALFFVTQLIALPSYFLFQCGSNGYREVYLGDTCDSPFLTKTMIGFLFSTATGMSAPINVVNSVTWFQSVFYTFLLLFPCTDNLFRRAAPTIQGLLLVVFLTIATVAFVFLFDEPGLITLNFTILAWIPTLASAMLAGYFFQRRGGACNGPGTSGKRWGYLTDALSVALLLVEVSVAFFTNDCIVVTDGTFAQMRPGADAPPAYPTEGLVQACGVTYEEFKEFVHSNPYDYINFGRWSTTLGYMMGFMRVGTPVALLWIYGMSVGRGLTARLFTAPIFMLVSSLAYSLYLLHLPVARYYWVATRGLDAEYWWNMEGLYPFPIEWYEVLLILLICVVLGAAIEKFLTPRIMPYAVKLGVMICNKLCSCCKLLCCCVRKTQQEVESSSSMSVSDIVISSRCHRQVEALVRGLTGSGVTRTTRLRDLGLDSLGATALLSALRASVSGADKLTMKQLAGLDTVGDLLDFLDRSSLDDCRYGV